MFEKNDLIDLCLKENWELHNENTIIANNQEYQIGHPLQIHLNIYKTSPITEIRFNSFKRIKDILWPQYIITNNYWHDDIFYEHCNKRSFIVSAGGANLGKSFAWAVTAFIYYIADQANRGVIISSTTLDSIERRIWGYVARLTEEISLPLNLRYIGGKPPKIIRPGQKDKISGMYAVAVKEGDAERTIASIIGTHPPGGVLFILDEATDISSNVVKSFANLLQTPGFNQIAAIGNSKDTTDLHGALATPKDGWPSIDPDIHTKWLTTHENGICIYFNPFNSPAIHEKDPIRKQALSNFLVTEEKIKKLELQYGKGSDQYRRFVLGYWHMLQSTERLLVTRKFLQESHTLKHAEWSGLYPLIRVAALDPAISQSQKGCALRFGVLGHETTGKVVLDLGGEENIRYIDTRSTDKKSSELQLIDSVIYWLAQYKVPLSNLVIDTTGMGRMIGEFLKVRMVSNETPLKIIWTGKSKKGSEVDDSVITMSPTEMWFQLRDFIQSSQIRGMDDATAFQLSNRKINVDQKGRPILELKSDYVVRIGAVDSNYAYSPNEADTAVLMLQLAIWRLGFKLGETRPVVNTFENFTLEKLHKHTLEINQMNKIEKKKELDLRADFSGSVETMAWIKNGG